METVEKRIIAAHNWIKPDNRNFTPYGHKPLGEKSSIVDQVYVPFKHTTYVLVFESSWATIGGVVKVAVLYAYDHRTGKRHVVSSHTIFDGKGPMSHFYPTKIGATISFVTRDFQVDEHSDRIDNYDFGYATRYRMPLDAQTSQAGAVVRKHWVTAKVSMRSDREDESRFELNGCYEAGHIKKTWPLWYSRLDVTPVSLQEWTTGEVESSVLTKRNISRFYRKYIEEVPLLTNEIGGG